jgi:SAM-dependent methyltransferase
MSEGDSTRELVREYYGKDLSSADDLKTTACSCAAPPSDLIAGILTKVHPTVKSKFYGCGSPFPPLLSGQTVLDLGCGTGRDVYVASALVGESGHAIGVDMTDEQLGVANAFQEYHARQFGYERPNTEYVLRAPVCMRLAVLSPMTIVHAPLSIRT